MIAVLLLSLALQVSPELRERVEAGLKAKAAGDLDRAIREFTRVVELAPALPAAHVNLGAVYFEKKDYSAAIPPLRKALELNADLPAAHQMLGAALLSQGFAMEAIPHLEKVQSDDLLGVALLEAGRVRESVDRLEAALQKRPNDPDLLYYLARAHELLSRQLHRRLQSEHADSARAEQLQGETLAASGDYSAAQKHFRAALAKRPDLRAVHHALGELLLESGDYERAEAEFRAEARLTPGSAVTAYKLGVTLLHRGILQEAISELKRSNTLHPGMPETELELGRALHAAGEAEAAEHWLRKALQHESSGSLAASAHFLLAEIYRKQGRVAEADQEMKLFQRQRK